MKDYRIRLQSIEGPAVIRGEKAIDFLQQFGIEATVPRVAFLGFAMEAKVSEDFARDHFSERSLAREDFGVISQFAWIGFDTLRAGEIQAPVKDCRYYKWIAGCEICVEDEAAGEYERWGRKGTKITAHAVSLKPMTTGRVVELFLANQLTALNA